MSGGKIFGTIVKNSPDPSHFEEMGQGGYRSVADIAARDAIPLPLRKEGMRVYVLADGVIYRKALPLTSDGLTWEVADAGFITNRVVFQPGGPVNTGPIYNDFNSLKQAVNSIGIPAIIDLDATFATSEIPALGAPHVFTKPVFLWTNLVQGQFLQFEDGASIQNVAEIRGAIINILGLTGGAAVQFAPGQVGFNIVDGFVQGARPLASYSVARIRLINTDLDSSGPYFEGSTISIISQLGSSDVPNNSIGGTGNALFEINADSVAGPVQANAGTKTYSYQDPAQQPFITRTSAGTLDGRRSYVFNSVPGFSQAMPDPATVNGPLRLKNIGAGTITLTSSGTVNPSTLATGESATFMGDGTNWEGI